MIAAAADLVVLLHFAFVVFVVCGGFLVLRWPRLAWLHLPAAVWGVLIELCGWVCPLTPLEQYLRRLASRPPYAGGFVEHYILPILYPAELTRSLQLGMGAAVLLLNGVIYVLVYRHWRRRRSHRINRNEK